MNVDRIWNNCLYVPNSSLSKTRTMTSGVRKESANARRFAPVNQAARSMKLFSVGTLVTIMKSTMNGTYRTYKTYWAYKSVLLAELANLAILAPGRSPLRRRG